MEPVLRFLSSPLLPSIGITMVAETLIEGGNVPAWICFTLVTSALYGVANYYHEGTEDIVEDMYDEMDDTR
jgi:hypothetical protein